MKLDILNFNKKKRVTITKINIMWKGAVHSMEGMGIKNDSFEIEIPFHNKRPENMLTKMSHGESILKTQQIELAVITKIEASAPFKLLSLDPPAPVEVKPDQKVVLKLKLSVPDHSYNGPVNIIMSSDSKELTHIEITKIVLKRGSKSVEIENSAKIIDVPKGQIFTQSVQLYKIINYRDKVNDIEVNAPFELVSQDPNPPFEIDNANSYIEALYILAPEFGYAGPLEITLK